MFLNGSVKISIIIVLCLFFIFSIFFTKKESPTISNITISYANSLVVPKNNEISVDENGLVDLSTLPTNLIIELRYASKNNFAEKLFYPQIAKE